jgi:hypothetical protein
VTDTGSPHPSGAVQHPAIGGDRRPRTPRRHHARPSSTAAPAIAADSKSQPTIGRTVSPRAGQRHALTGSEAIGRNSNLGHLCKNWADLRKSIDESSPRPLLSQPNGPKPRAKRLLTADAVTDIVRRYEGGETTQQVGKRYGISKTRVASILTRHGVPIRRQGLNEEQVNGAAGLYVAGKSLAWIGAVYGVSHTTVAAALRRKDVELRPRPGWV